MCELTEDEATNYEPVMRRSVIVLGALIARPDLRADRHGNCLLNFERKLFFTEYVNSDEKKIACTK